MAIQVRQFSVGKDTDLSRINRFFQEAGLKPANIISIELVEQGRDRATLIVTYEDITAPRLLLTLPADGDTNVAVGTPIIAIFSEAIQNVTTADIAIRDVTNGSDISTALYSIDNTGASLDRGEIRIVDEGYMTANVIYRITFKTSIKDLAGNALAEQESILLGLSVVASNLSFDGGEISAFTLNTALGNNRYEAIVTPSRVSYSDSSILHLDLRAPEDTFLNEFQIFHEQIASPTGSFRSVIQASGTLPTGDISLVWSIIEGLL